MSQGIVYCRVSSQDQTRGTSLENQRRACLEYAESRAIKVLKVFVEKGESATAANRTELIRALDYCKEHKGRATAFIVWKLDRFARNLTDHYGLQAQLLKYGTSLHSVTEEIISEGPIGKMMEAVLAGYAQFENDIRKQRCEGGMQARLRDGIRPWTPPLGYIHSKNRTDRRKVAPDQPDPERFHLIQKGMRLYIDGQHTITRLTEVSNGWGLRTRTGRPMRKQLWEAMLTNKFYAGVLVDPWTGEEHRGHHQPMIDLDEYHRIRIVKRGLSNNAIKRRPLLHPDFPLRGLVLCNCGRPLTGSSSKGRSKYYARYRCHNGNCARKVSISKKNLEQQFVRLLAHVAPNEFFIKLFKTIVLDEWKHSRLAVSAETTSYQRNIKQVGARKRELMLMRVNREITKEEYLEMRDALDNQLTALDIAKNKALTSQLDLESSTAYAETFIQTLARQWQDLKDSAKRAWLQRLVLPNGIAYDGTRGTFGTPVLSPIFRLNQEYHEQQSDLVALVRRDWHQIADWLDEVKQYAQSDSLSAQAYLKQFYHATKAA